MTLFSIFKKKSDTNITLQGNIERKKYSNQTVTIQPYSNLYKCQFKDCTIIYQGNMHEFSQINCTFKNCITQVQPLTKTNSNSINQENVSDYLPKTEISTTPFFDNNGQISDNTHIQNIQPPRNLNPSSSDINTDEKTSDNNHIQNISKGKGKEHDREKYLKQLIQNNIPIKSLHSKYEGNLYDFYPYGIKLNENLNVFFQNSGRFNAYKDTIYYTSSSFMDERAIYIDSSNSESYWLTREDLRYQKTIGGINFRFLPDSYSFNKRPNYINYVKYDESLKAAFNNIHGDFDDTIQQREYVKSQIKPFGT